MTSDSFLEEQKRRLLVRREAYVRLATHLPSGEIDLHTYGKLTTSMRFIELALGRMQDGSYGMCIDCDEPIPQARLIAVPGAIRCTGCQVERDETHAHTG